MSDEQVVRRAVEALRGDAVDVRAALDELNGLFEAHQGAVFALCARLVGDRERAREIAQDAVFAAWEQLPAFRGEASFRTWLLRIARYQCFRALRRQRDLLTEDGVIEATDPNADVYTHLRRHEKEEVLRQASLAVLDKQEQDAVYMRYAERLPIEVITDVLGLDSASGARGLLQRCKRKLAHELRERLAAMGHGTSFVRGTW